MENPEEVLQALDEFQKLRPSEIPKELEDYLCWVAKTGDPVYQWGLVKALFREKLTRVITEFYESCPSLDLTPCPNVEPFNYDAMKRNLVERLENFVNAPFTVQRICELLTTPRKEYNRVDKFMRAIEKNILVVSTREPGANGRRSENGDNLVNGSVDDESSHHEQSSNEVDMENWVKDCTASTTVPLHNEEAENMENGLKSRIEPQISVADATASSFVVSSSNDFSPTTTVSSQDNIAVQNLSGVHHEATGTIIGDVSDVIMNEDTSSQPSLELESDESDSNDSKKLQTTFQAKDFMLEEEKLTKEYSKAVTEKKPGGSIEDSEVVNKDCEKLITSTYADETDAAAGDLISTDKTDNVDGESAVNEVEKVLLNEAQTSESSELESNAPIDNFVPVEENLNVKNDNKESFVVDSTESLSKETCDTDAKIDSKIESPEKSVSNVTESIESSASQAAEQVVPAQPITAELIKPIVEEPLVETTDPTTTTSVKPESAELTIEETTEEEVKPTKSIVPDPIPIVEEPKEAELSSKDWENSTSQAEEMKKDIEATINNGLTESLEQQDDSSKMVVTGSEETPTIKAVTVAAESMEVDSEAAAAQQDEPMEQEMTEAMSS
ncbi:serine/threonine-protein phosphatase 4 regulatory subunit 2 isoform X2 [Phymastichus coffea]|nr:serine/threonine-protein phosphatase 4 regulatory subunit 2 isoform X2 [Phymastichus coffea]XP_058803048.1 serine/threonine-protein phosphatase 4 regulatory subunit 2 isoform X2 [Phymastichus coffea]